ncbi:30S ribosomal protein S4 [Candidatus Roizmanbacteria bacterium]|nr:30S ribosomal protein S4 [Candidatus Roizmanbacteria bacterium]
MRYTGPRNRIARREGMDLGLKTPGSKSHARLLKKLNVFPGQHGLKGRRKISEHAYQLREKQKLRFLFGVTEKQLKKYYVIGTAKKGNTAFYLCQFLEKRLDNLVFRAGFAPTRASARQLVTHGHINVNDKTVTVPSYVVKVDDIITFAKEKSTKIPYIEQMLTNKDTILPKWLERKATVGKLIAEPTQEEIAKQINLRLVIEFYSR